MVQTNTKIDAHILPLISVIIPTYNRKEYLLEAVDSVFNQTYNKIEIIIVDDGSTDGSEEAIRTKNDPRINYIWQRNSGLPAAARNVGIGHAKGEYIAFLDSDDLWLPEKLEVQLNVLIKNPQLICAASNAELIPETKDTVPVEWNTIINEYFPTFQELLKANIIYNSSVLMRKEIVKKIGPLDENIGLRAIEDFEYWLRILKNYPRSIAVSPKPLIKYRLHDGNIFTANTQNNKYKSKAAYCKKMSCLYNKQSYSWQLCKLILVNKVHYGLALFRSLLP